MSAPKGAFRIKASLFCRRFTVEQKVGLAKGHVFGKVKKDVSFSAHLFVVFSLEVVSLTPVEKATKHYCP